MPSNTSTTPDRSSTRGVTRETIPDPAGNDAAVARDADAARPQAAVANGAETRSARFRRKARRSRLYAYAIGAVALVAFLIALAVTNTARVKVSWVFGTSRVSLVWLVLFAAILGWLLGLVATAAFHWRTRAPRRRRATS